MLVLLIAVILAELENQGVLAFFIVPLPEELFLHLFGRAAKAHLVQLGHVVHQADAAAGPGVDQKVHEAHDAPRRLIERKGRRGAVPPHGVQQAEAVGILAREKAEKGKAGEIKAGDGESVDSGTAARNPDHADALADGGADQLVARVGDAGRTGIGDDGDGFARLQLGNEPGGLPVLVELMVRNQAVSDAQLVEQHHGAPGVLGRDQIGLFQNLPAAGRKIGRIADGRRNNIKNAVIQSPSLPSGTIIANFPCIHKFFVKKYFSSSHSAENMVT